MRLISDGFSETGIRRNQNQDAVGIFTDEEQGLFLVSDGIGGHSEGRRASQEVQAACQRWWEQYLERCRQGKEPDLCQTVRELKEMLAMTSRKIWDETSQKEICGATVVLLWIWKTSYALLWSGDSRCYLAEARLLGAKVHQLTIDDVWENQPEQQSRYSRDELLGHPDFGKLVRAAGVSPDFICTVRTGILDGKSLFALCSDGVYKYMAPGSLEAVLKGAVRQDDFGKAFQMIRDKVYGNQAPDNLSCVLVKAEKKG